MEISIIFKIAALGIVITVLGQVLKHSGREEMTFLLSLAGLVIVLFWIVPYISELFKAMQDMFREIPYLDVLVNNAGISYIGLLTDMTYEEWQQVLRTNLDSCFLTCRNALPGMIHRKKGKIINISSVWGNVGASMEVAYSASKGGVNSFTKALAKELGPSNIQVNAIACGVIDTDMNKCFSEEERQELIAEIPADRMGRAQEVAQLVVQLCTGNEYLTGQIITLDGGWI